MNPIYIQYARLQDLLGEGSNTDAVTSKRKIPFDEELDKFIGELPSINRYLDMFSNHPKGGRKKRRKGKGKRKRKRNKKGSRRKTTTHNLEDKQSDTHQSQPQTNPR